MQETIFSKIINKEIPADIVFENEDVVAFLDISPNTKGHTLVVPKKYFENIFTLDDETITKVFSTAREIAKACKEKLGATGVNIVMNNGSDAGQIVFHAHVHVIPRYDGGFSKKYTYAEGEKEETRKLLEAYFN